MEIVFYKTHIAILREVVQGELIRLRVLAAGKMAGRAGHMKSIYYRLVFCLPVLYTIVFFLFPCHCHFASFLFYRHVLKRFLFF